MTNYGMDHWPIMLVSSPSMESGDVHSRWDLNRYNPAAIERSNLVRICKLVIGELLESAGRIGGVIDSAHVPLQHLFVVIEHCLLHGLKPRRSLLGVKRDVWAVLQLVEAISQNAADITTSARDLPTAKTTLGKARAWIRLAMMQKKLAEYLKMLLDRRDLLEEYYEEHSLLLSEEAVHILGLLIGLNTIDCNLCLKEQEFDVQQSVIDFSMYLRPLLTDNMSQSVLPSCHEHIVEQKNYIEELNRKLNSAMITLQVKLEEKSNLCSRLQDELLHLRESEPNSVNGATQEAPTESVKRPDAPLEDCGDQVGVQNQQDELKRLKQELQQLQVAHAQLSKEVKLQVEMKAEVETANKLLETDIHEKQDTMVSLRQQLGHIKSINIELYNKLQESQSVLKDYSAVITTLEGKLLDKTSAIHKIDGLMATCDKKRKTAEDAVRVLTEKLSLADTSANQMSSDLKIEREWRESLQAGSVNDKDAIGTLRHQIESLTLKLKEKESLEVEMERLRVKCGDHERTLEELGQNLSESKLEISELRGTARGILGGQWVPDEMASQCSNCALEFSISRRKHHCRHCGQVYCNSCSTNSISLASSSKPMRVCDGCHTFLQHQQSVS